MFDHALKTFKGDKPLGFTSTFITFSCFHIMINHWNSCFIYSIKYVLSRRMIFKMVHDTFSWLSSCRQKYNSRKKRSDFLFQLFLKRIKFENRSIFSQYSNYSDLQINSPDSNIQFFCPCLLKEKFDFLHAHFRYED